MIYLQRGLVTWLTGAVDKRVVAIAPAVWDMLGLVKVPPFAAFDLEATVFANVPYGGH